MRPVLLLLLLLHLVVKLQPVLLYSAFAASLHSFHSVGVTAAAFGCRVAAASPAADAAAPAKPAAAAATAGSFLFLTRPSQRSLATAGARRSLTSPRFGLGIATVGRSSIIPRGNSSTTRSTSSNTSRSSSSRLFVWGVPLFGDGAGRVRRASADFGFEIGQHEANIAYDYQTANLLSQRVLLEQRQGTLVFIEEDGLGRAADTLMTAEEAAGGTRVDPNELKKVENVLPSFTRPDGSGLLRLLSACDGKFAFVYQGPLEHKFGVKEWVRYLITSAYPGAEVKFLTEHYSNPDDRPGSLKGFVPDEEVSEYRKAFRWKYPRLYHHEEGKPLPGGYRRSPQPIP